jgi:TonB family protein
MTIMRTLRKGEVQVRFVVLPDGSVSEPSVVSSSNARLNASAMEAISHWRFAPIRKAQAGIVEMAFNLD